MRGNPLTSCLEMMGEEQTPVMNHRVPSVGSGGGGMVTITRMKSSHSSQDVASITNEQDYWEYGPGIVDRLKSKFINLSLSRTHVESPIISASAKRNNLRSCASLENLQDNTPSFKAIPINSSHKLLMTSPANMRDPRKFVPKSPSMEALLDSTRTERIHGSPTNRCVVSSSISSVVESELPRRDIVRKYKTFFEQSSSPQHQQIVAAPSHPKSLLQPAGILKPKTSPVKKPVANIKPLVKEPEPERKESPPPVSKTKEPTVQAVQDAVLNELNLQSSNGYHDIMSLECTVENRTSSSIPIVPRTPTVNVKLRTSPLLLSENNSRPQQQQQLPQQQQHQTITAHQITPNNCASSSMGTTMVFDFRGKDVKPQIAVQPCPARVSKEELDSQLLEETPEPCGITFIGENVIVGGGSLISTRNKNLSIRFDDDNLSSRFEYEAEEETDTDTDTEEEDVSARGLPSAALGNYKPGVLSLDEDDFQYGISRLRREQPQESTMVKPSETSTDPPEDEFRPASQDETSMYSQVGSSDLLF